MSFVPVNDYTKTVSLEEPKPYTDSEWGEVFYAPEPPTEYIPLSIPEMWDEEIPEVAAWMELEDQL